MAETATHPLVAAPTLGGWSARFAALAPAVMLSETPAAQVSLRTTRADAGRGDLPAPCQLRRTGDRTAIWLGPDEFLICHTGTAPSSLLGEIESDFGTSAYAADASGQRTRLILRGPHARTILAHGCAVDLAEQAFGPDDVVQTLLAQAGVIIHRADTTAGEAFAIFVRTSFADYLAEWLVDAATEYCSTES